MEKVFICILSCEKYSHKREIQNISDLEAEYRYFIGNPNLSQAVENGNIVYLPCPDSYEYLTRKTLQAFKWMEENIEADFYYKTDDDTIFNKKEFDILHESVVRSKVEYGGEAYHGRGIMSAHHCGKCEDDSINKKRFYVPNIVYAKGGGYVLSKDSLRIINQTDNKQEYFCIYEDATIGNILNSHGILVKHLNIRKSFNWDTIQ